jgi:hypothetical protein
MTVRIPDHVRRGLRESLWQVADRLDWQKLTWYEKSAHYEHWTHTADVGGLLSHYMDAKHVRVYIKDTVMKGYVRSRQADAAIPFAAFGISSDVPILEKWERPHGRRLADGRVVAWGNAEDWKSVLMAIHERAWGTPTAHPYGAALLDAGGRFADPSVRTMVADAATRLRVQRLRWIE